MDKLKDITDNIVLFFPIYYRKLLDMHLEKDGITPSSPSFRMLCILSYHGTYTMSELGKKLGISKPQMTALADELISKKLIVREHQDNDRRNVTINITSDGKKFTKDFLKIIKNTIKKNLTSLNQKDIDKLYISLKESIAILSKLYDAKEFEKITKYAKSKD